MIISTDKMGGFIEAKIIALRDVATFVVKNGTVKITFKNSVVPEKLNVVKNGIDASSASSMTKAGELFTIDVNIELKNSEEFYYKSFNKFLALLTTSTQKTFIYGTPSFPLTMKTQHKVSKMASGKSGTIITLSGKQPNNILLLE